MKPQVSFMDKMKIRYNFLKLVKNPSDTERIFRISHLVTSTADPELVEKVLQHAISIPRFRQMWEEKYFPQLPSLHELSQYPCGSFGHEYYLHMKKLKLDPDLFPAANFTSLATYMTTRIYQAHDFWHVLTGFGTSIEEELGLQGFGVAQYRAPMSSMIIAGGILHLLEKNPIQVNVAMDFVAQGLQMGSRCSFLLAEPVLEELRLPLKDVRAKYGVRPLQCA